jgi:hypothetical protein
VLRSRRTVKLAESDRSKPSTAAHYATCRLHDADGCAALLLNFLFSSLVCAEMVRWKTSGKADLDVLGAMTPALGTLAVHYPLISAGRSVVPHFWPPGVAEWPRIPEFYLRFCR